MDENQLSQIIVDAAIEVHRTLGGPGLLESIYRGALAFEIRGRGLPVKLKNLCRLNIRGRRLAHPCGLIY
jgi:GxxExxY protein